jgi:hypothetical protein
MPVGHRWMSRFVIGGSAFRYMISIVIRDSLPFVSLDVTYRGTTITLSDVLLDTGSAGTILSTDSVMGIGLEPELGDTIREVVGVGGSEPVVEKSVDFIAIDGRTVANFVIELGGMDYGFTIDGIVGLDLLRALGVTIDLDRLELRAK